MTNYFVVQTTSYIRYRVYRVNKIKNRIINSDHWHLPFQLVQYLINLYLLTNILMMIDTNQSDTID